MNNTLLDEIVSDIQNKKYDSAIFHCNELISKYPDNYNLYEIRSGCFNAIGSFDSAIADLTNAINKTRNSSVSKNDLLKLFLKRGKIYIKKQEWEFASNDFIEVLKINNDLPDVHNTLSICYKKLAKYNDALFHSSNAIRLNGNFAEAYNNRANINICLDKYDDAISDYSRSISINPNNAKGYFNRGSIYYEVFKDKDKCLNDFISAIKLNPDYESEIYSNYPELKDNLSETKSEDVINTQSSANNETENEINTLLTKISDNDSNNEKQVVTSAEEIVVPELDFKSIFINNETEDDSHFVEEQNQSSVVPEISNDLKKLHNEIANDNNKIITDESNEFKGFKGTDPLNDNNLNKNSFSDFKQHSVEPKKNFLRTPVFFLILIGLMVIIIVLSVLKFYKSSETVVVSNDVYTKVDTNVSVNKDTLKENNQGDTTKNTEKDENLNEPIKTEEIKTKEVAKTETPLESKNLGYISDKKQFVLFSEPDGYYVQIGSYKEKSKADEKLKILKNNNIKGAVTEADLKEKGIFYRVRAGAFKTPEEAKEIAGKIE